ncbi:MAG: hypothetical protein JSW27_04400 [Phycisphaerales bacterium]|nr:MAG: hypothetical protein JSW27_04400 [Phycisphaerales bacterium]
MASEAQLVANRLNARKSTGPRTDAGKTIVAQNGIRHGFTARQDVIGSESQAQFDRHRERMLKALAPVGPVESELAERIVSLSWRLRRAGRFQNEAIDALNTPKPLQKLTQSLLARRGQGEQDGADDELALGRMLVKDFSNHRVLDRLLMYERRIENSLYRSLVEFQRLQLVRQLDPVDEIVGSGSSSTVSV